MVLRLLLVLLDLSLLLKLLLLLLGGEAVRAKGLREGVGRGAGVGELVRGGLGVALRSVGKSRGRREGREDGRVARVLGRLRLVEGAEDGGGGRDGRAEVAAAAAALFERVRKVSRRRDRERRLGDERVREGESRRRWCLGRSRTLRGVGEELRRVGRGAPFAREDGGGAFRRRDVFEGEFGRGEGRVLDAASLEAGETDAAVEDDDAVDRRERSSLHSARRATHQHAYPVQARQQGNSHWVLLPVPPRAARRRVLGSSRHLDDLPRQISIVLDLVALLPSSFALALREAHYDLALVVQDLKDVRRRSLVLCGSRIGRRARRCGRVGGRADEGAGELDAAFRREVAAVLDRGAAPVRPVGAIRLVVVLRRILVCDNGRRE